MLFNTTFLVDYEREVKRNSGCFAILVRKIRALLADRFADNLRA